MQNQNQRIQQKNIEKAIASVQSHRCTERRLSFAQIMADAESAEKHFSFMHLLKKDAIGAKCRVGAFRFKDFSRRYKFSPIGTMAVIQRGKDSWYLISVNREDCRFDKKYILTDEQKNLIAKAAIDSAEML